MVGRSGKPAQQAEGYRHRERAILRPEVGTQPQFKKRKQPRQYRYDDSLSPALDWDGQNPGREIGEWLLVQIEEAPASTHRTGSRSRGRFGDVVVDGLEDAAGASQKH